MAEEYPWERPLGARVVDDALVELRTWAPAAQHARVHVRGVEHDLADEGYGVRSARVPASAGDDYWLVLDGKRFPDPASRWQPAGLRGPSRVLDAAAFAWSDAGFAAAPLRDTVLYELHVGTFTVEGTFEAAAARLPALAGTRALRTP